MDRAAILGDGRTLEVRTALGGAGAGRPATVVQGSGAVAVRMAGADAADGIVAPLAEAMRRHIESALAATGGQIEGREGAAMLLDINPHTLRARMRKLDIDWRRFRG
jgi:transcriptional regulator with GAF, ATPase, and Fis domain